MIEEAPERAVVPPLEEDQVSIACQKEDREARILRNLQEYRRCQTEAATIEGAMSTLPDIARDEEELALERVRYAGDLALRNVVEDNMGLVFRAIQRYVGRPGTTREDLRQQATYGLIKAVQGFDTTRNVNFATFAVPTITGTLRHYVRDALLPVHISRQIYEKIPQMTRLAVQYQNAGESANCNEIAEETGLPASVVRDFLEGNMTEVASTDSSLPNAVPIAEVLEDERAEAAFAKTETDILLQEVLDSLDERERTIIFGLYFEGRTQGDISKELGLSQMHVSRLAQRIRAKLAKHPAIKELSGR